MTLANAITKIKATLNAGVKPAPDSFEEALQVVVDAVGVSIEFPDVTSEDNGKVMKVVEGAWAKANEETVLPAVTSDDNSKVLTVVEGVWTKANLPAETVELPAVTADDNGKVLTVVEGAWAVAALPSG